MINRAPSPIPCTVQYADEIAGARRLQIQGVAHVTYFLTTQLFMKAGLTRWKQSVPTQLTFDDMKIYESPIEDDTGAIVASRVKSHDYLGMKRALPHQVHGGEFFTKSLQEKIFIDPNYPCRRSVLGFIAIRHATRVSTSLTLLSL
jgi:hypothetical protein